MKKIIVVVVVIRVVGFVVYQNFKDKTPDNQVTPQKTDQLVKPESSQTNWPVEKGKDKG